MIAQIVTDKDGRPVDGNGQALAVSSYQPPQAITKLFSQCQLDYQVAWNLQHRPFNEFDGYSLLERTKLDQQTFGAFVGVASVPEHKKWRWKGRKNTARNKVIGILAHVLAGMLFPYCYAYNQDNEEDAMTAKVMRIIIEDKLKRAKYETKFLFMMTSALVNPAVFVEVEYVEALQRIKMKDANGKWRVEEVVDELMSGLGLAIHPVDTILLGDFYTFDNQMQPYMVKVKRISYDNARKVWSNRYYVPDPDTGGTVDVFNFVRAGTTRVVMAGQENATLFDIEWTEAEPNFVQELTFYYRGEDLEVTFVGGVYMGDHTQDPYLCNPFKHRRMSMIKDKWVSIPIYPFAKSGFEPLDPAGRFAYYKSACFKEFWDDAAQNKMHQLAYDGTFLDVIKPIFLSGVAKVDRTTMMPGATIGMPMGASVTPYQLGPNLQAALQMMRTETDDMSDSTQDKIMSGITQKGVTAYATQKAEQNAKVFLGVFGIMIADLVRQIGDLVIDDIVMHETVGELDATIPGKLNMKYKTMMMKGKEGGAEITNRISFDSSMMDHDMTKEEANKLEWNLFEKSGGMNTKQRNYIVNPYKFARHIYALTVDPDMIISRSMGTDQLRKDRAFNILTDPRVAPYVDQQAVVDKFVLEEYSDGDPDEFKKKAAAPGAPAGPNPGTPDGGQVVPPGGQPNIPGMPTGPIGQ